MSDLAGRPLTIITPAMLTAARVTGGTIYARMSRCGRYWTFQAATHCPREGIPVADAEDIRLWLAATGNPHQAGAAIVAAWHTQRVS